MDEEGLLNRCRQISEDDDKWPDVVREHIAGILFDRIRA